VDGWIRDCALRHSSCPSDAKTLLPKRVIRIDSNGDKLKLSLHESAPNEVGYYACLSHCWALSEPLELTRGNQNERIQGISWEELPLTFQDAVLIAQWLRLRYLWIDSLCILQDDRDDWELNSMQMGQIYESSYVTFAVHGELDKKGEGCHLSKNDTHELIARSDSGDSVPVFVRSKPSQRGFFLSGFRGAYFERAWCFQERLLAPRVLHFTKSEIVFECQDGLQCECGRISEIHTADQRHHLKGSYAAMLQGQIKPRLYGTLVGKRNVRGKDKARLWITWNAFAEDYASKRLSFPTDTLPALSSVASRMPDLLGRYFAGLWEFDLIRGLL
jgi:hypothetical protein